MFSIFTLFTRSRLYANLSPGERAVLRFIAVLAGGAFLSGVQAAAPLLSTLDPTQVPWASVGHTFLAAFALAVWLGIGKYRSAQGDPPLPSPAPIDLPSAPPIAPPALPPAAPPASSLVSAPAASASTAGANAAQAG